MGRWWSRATPLGGRGRRRVALGEGQGAGRRRVPLVRVGGGWHSEGGGWHRSERGGSGAGKGGGGVGEMSERRKGGEENMCCFMICTPGLPSAAISHLAKILKIALPSVLELALGKDNFVECPLTSTRQRLF
jgi:hypothetical protein